MELEQVYLLVLLFLLPIITSRMLSVRMRSPAVFAV